MMDLFGAAAAEAVLTRESAEPIAVRLWYTLVAADTDAERAAVRAWGRYHWHKLGPTEQERLIGRVMHGARTPEDMVARDDVFAPKRRDR